MRINSLFGRVFPILTILAAILGSASSQCTTSSDCTFGECCAQYACNEGTFYYCAFDFYDHSLLTGCAITCWFFTFEPSGAGSGSSSSSSSSSSTINTGTILAVTTASTESVSVSSSMCTDTCSGDLTCAAYICNESTIYSCIDSNLCGQ